MGQYRGKSKNFVSSLLQIMKLSRRQKDIIYGLILGDGYLQKTGASNARLRLEHSEKQKDLIDWKYLELSNIFGKKPKKISRIHPINHRQYNYYRLQSNSSPLFGSLRSLFYRDGKKIIPNSIGRLIKSHLTLAVWYMDDGYYYKRDESAHIYLPNYSRHDNELVVKALKDNFNIQAKYYCRPDRKSCHINITGENRVSFFSIVSKYIIKSLRYKVSFDPVTTVERES